DMTNTGSARAMCRATACEASRAGGGMAEKRDIVIAGGGYVGLSLALAVKQAAPGLDVLLVDAAARRGVDLRASAVAAGARRMLDRLGVWSAVAGEAQPILDMVITDSRLGDAVRP